MFNKEQMKHVWLAVIAGGKGTRLFPISHDGCPKQFCELNKSQTFIQAAIERFLRLGVRATQVVIITTNERQTQLAKEQTMKLGVLSQNICEVDERFGYPGVMVKAAEIIAEIDKDAIIVNSPSDQYIVEGPSFANSILHSLEIAANHKVAIVGVKINDLVTATGCGHVVYDPDALDETGFSKMTDFVEKPERDVADRLMRNSSSACNTGINVWRADALLRIITSEKILERKNENPGWELHTDVFLKMLPEVYATAGTFEWHDCGTLSALYDVASPENRTPNHHNVSIGGGEVDRHECLNGLFYAPKGFRLHMTGLNGVAVAANVIEIRDVIYPIICVIKLSDSQRVKKLAEDITASHQVLNTDFQVNARNNMVMRSNISKETIFGFVGVDNCFINVHKNPDGVFDVFVAQQFETSKIAVSTKVAQD